MGILFRKFGDRFVTEDMSHRSLGEDKYPIRLSVFGSRHLRDHVSTEDMRLDAVPIQKLNGHRNTIRSPRFLLTCLP